VNGANVATARKALDKAFPRRRAELGMLDNEIADVEVVLHETGLVPPNPRKRSKKPKLVAVIGFPLGASSTSSKKAETKDAISSVKLFS
jgi:hypothetical protein